MNGERATIIGALERADRGRNSGKGVRAMGGRGGPGVRRGRIWTAPPAEKHELTERQREVLALVAEGLMSREIGVRLGISCKTVEGHLADIFDRLGVRTRTGAVVRYFMRT
jgi:DNA-binding NarL/FixJ family response regulator